MDFKVNREIISSDEIINDSVQEQYVELDCILPDYYPDIFKILKCIVCPSILSKNITGDKVSYELFVKINIMYCAENSSVVRCVEQKMTFTKTADLGVSCDNPMVTLTPSVDYVNCRAVNQRRLDIRGAVSTKIKARCERKKEAVCGAYGMNVQLKKEKMTYAGKRICKQKSITVTDDIDIGYSKPAISGIIRSSAVNISADKKIIANKIIVKGEAKVNLLYCCEEGTGFETMEFTLPYSQIIDAEGVDESCECIVDAEITRCEVMAKENSDNEMKIIEAELCVLLTCTAVCAQNAELVTDAYSTTYGCECKTSDTAIETMPKRYTETILEKIPVSVGECKINCVCDAWSKVKNTTVICDDEAGTVKITGTVTASVIALGEENRPALFENEQVFEHMMTCSDTGGKIRAEGCAEAISTAFSINDTGNIEVKSEIRICLTTCSVCSHGVITDIEIDEENTKKTEDFALKMYFAEENESLWDIAKKYSTSIDAIVEENENCEDTDGRRTLLIPIVS